MTVARVSKAPWPGPALAAMGWGTGRAVGHPRDPAPTRHERSHRVHNRIFTSLQIGILASRLRLITLRLRPTGLKQGKKEIIHPYCAYALQT